MENMVDLGITIALLVIWYGLEVYREKVGQ
jgi:hypothetical protein